MLIENVEYREQIRNIIERYKNIFEALNGKAIMISGAAGMIGSCVVDILLLCNEEFNKNIQIYALGRTKTKLEHRFERHMEEPYMHLVEQDISKPFVFKDKMDYMIHAASNADPAMMAQYPVDTLLANVTGMNNCLEAAKKQGSKRVLYVSSGEMYGQPDDTVQNGFVEGYCGYVDYGNPRSCYPSGKRAAEVLCQSYLSQYGLETVIVRPCHCYGPTMTNSDSRAISQFFRKVMNGEDIILKSDGSLERSHCYVVDAAMAILYVLIYGESGNAYNIADKKSKATIKELAIAITNARNKKVVFDLPDELEKKGFSKVVRAVLNVEKLERLGWNAETDLNAGINKTLSILSGKLQE